MKSKGNLYASLINGFGGAISGYNTGIVAGLTYPLIKCTIFDYLSESEIAFYQGLFNSIILFFAMISSPLSVILAEKVGLKIPLFILSVIALVCPILMVIYTNFWYMLAMRGILGISIGFISTLCPMYTTLTASPEVKGRVATVLQIAICTSICIAQIMNLFFTPSYDNDKCTALSPMQYGIQLGSGAIFALGLLITLFFSPNTSPHSTKPSIPKKTNVNVETKTYKLFSKQNMKWVLFAVMLAAVNQFTGINGVIYYSPQLLIEAGIEQALLVNIIVVGVWNTLTVFIFMGIVDRLSRYTILNISLGIMAIGSILLIVSFYVSNLVVLAITGVIMFILGFEMGPGPLFYVMASQDFPKEIFDKGLSLSNFLLWIMNIVISFAFPSLNLHLGPGATFIILVIFQILCLLYFNLFNIKRKV